MSKIAALSLVTVLSFALGGCTVPAVGLAGIGVDATGALVGYLQVCRNHIDGATLYIDEDDDSGSWQASPAITGFARWSMTNPGDAWTTKAPLQQLRPNVTYHLYGWTSDNSASALSVTFTTDDLAALKPGQVRYWSGNENTAGTADLPTVSSEGEFRFNACNLFSGTDGHT